MITNGATIKRTMHEEFDAVVIGSGAGGAVVAKELAEGGMKVAILEEGGYHPTSSHHDTPWESVSRMYRDRAFTTTLGTPNVIIPLGRTLGGTTAINSGTCFRTPKPILERWRTKLGLGELTDEVLDPIFDRVEKTISVTNADFDVMSRSNTLIHELLTKRGTPGVPLRRNTKDCEGCGFCCYGCPSGAKQSTEVTYLPKASAHGARIFTNTRVERFIKTGKTGPKVVGVEAVFLDAAGARTEHRLVVKSPITIVAAGTFYTPSLLRNNGIGTDNRNLGRHLSLHPATKVFARFDEEIRGWEGIPQAYLSEVLKPEGITFEGIFIPPDIAAMTVPFVGAKVHQFMRDYSKMAAFGFLINDFSRGRILDLPLFGKVIWYDLRQEDVEKFRKGVAFLARLFLEGGAKRVHSLLRGYNDIATEADIVRLEKGRLSASDIESMAFHPLGTCRMGPTKKTGVIDQNHKIFGWEGIYVCDGSTIPTALGVNPQVTIMALATRLANVLLSKRNSFP